MDQKFQKISIIGLGLIGTSILHAIRQKKDENITTYAFDINPEHRNTVFKMGIATFVSDNIHDAIMEADLVILSIPVGSMKTVASLYI